MASWHTSLSSNVEWTRCPVHRSLAVRDLRCRWIWRCADCLAEAERALRRFARNGR